MSNVVNRAPTRGAGESFKRYSGRAQFLVDREFMSQLHGFTWGGSNSIVRCAAAIFCKPEEERPEMCRRVEAHKGRELPVRRTSSEL
jgi:hypothetical protein